MPLLEWADTGEDINNRKGVSGTLPLTPCDLQKCLVKVVKRTAVGVDDEEWTRVLAQMREETQDMANDWCRIDGGEGNEYCDQLCFGCM